MTEMKGIFAANLSSLRSQRGWTQVELGEKLNYSDKTISKWERGESIPDAAILKEISRLFGVSLDTLLTDHEGKDPDHWEENKVQKNQKKNKDKKKSAHQRLMELPSLERKHANAKHLLISTVSVSGMWLLAFGALIITWAVTGRLQWMIVAYTLPVMFILGIVFESVWGEKRLIWNLIFVTFLILCLILDVYLQIRISTGYNAWMLFLIMIPVEILLYFVYRLTAIDTWFWKKFKRDEDGKISITETISNTIKPHK